MSTLDKFGGTTDRQFTANGFFRLERATDRWWLVDPVGNGFISVGLNHAEETNLKYPHNLYVWQRKYGSRDLWIRDGVVKDFKQWGFNTIGWTQEWVTQHLRHTRGWSQADFQMADMPYCIVLPIAEIERWNTHPLYPDVFSEEFDAYCEYVARSTCVDHADDEKLIGYFLVDIPAWEGHPNGTYFEAGLDSQVPADRQRIKEIATKYYETICSYIRQYDPSHLILGDRLNGDAGIPEVVLQAMQPFVDVFSIQYFRPDLDQLRHWQAMVDKPVLLADVGVRCPTHFRPDGHAPGILSQEDRAEFYINTIRPLLDEPWFIGWHWCAYIENPARSDGVKNPWDEPHQDFVEPVSEFNHRVHEFVLEEGQHLVY